MIRPDRAERAGRPSRTPPAVPETGLPGNDSIGYRVEYPGLGNVSCVEPAKWLDGHEKALAAEPPPSPELCGGGAGVMRPGAGQGRGRPAEG